MLTVKRTISLLSAMGLSDSTLLFGDIMAELPIEEFPGATVC